MMQLTNTPARYGLVHQLFHWLMALVVIAMFALGLWMHDLPLGPDKLYWYGLHKSVGVLVLAAALLRYGWRLLNPAPRLPEEMAWHEKLGAHLAHLLLYGLLLAVPISGWLMSSAYGFPVSVFGWFTLPDWLSTDRDLAQLINEVHELLAFALIALASIHALAALYHHIIKKDNVLKRMLPWYT